MNYEIITRDLPVQACLDQLQAQPELWDQITARQEAAGSPHHDTKCIFLRWCPGQTIRDVFFQLESVDYPAAAVLAPAIAPMFNELLDRVPHEVIGRAMLVTLQPGGSIDEHIDEGAYADAHDRFHIVLQSDEGNAFTVGGETFHGKPGEAFWFNIKRPHSVVNNSARERIHLIVDLISPVYKAKRGVTFQAEDWQSHWDEMEPLFRAHWEEIALYKDIPLEPDRAYYEAMQTAGHLRVYSARDGGTLIGYAVFKVGGNAHYKSTLYASQDILFISPTHRRGRLGYRFIEWCDRQLQAEGVQVVLQHVKRDFNFGPLLERQGYELMDHIYAKRLDKPIIARGWGDR